MKLKEGYVLRNVAGDWVILPLLEADLNGMIKLNDSGALLWNLLEQGADLKVMVCRLTEAYDVSAEEAEEDVKAFFAKLKGFGCLQDI